MEAAQKHCLCSALRRRFPFYTQRTMQLALASFYNCDMLVTWNCRHLANANKSGHIRRVNALLGLRTPMLVTPLQLEQDEAQHTEISPNSEGLLLMPHPLFHPVNPVNPVKIQFFNCIVPA
jgi:hypothetical protein